jgi:hypothetical protein
MIERYLGEVIIALLVLDGTLWAVEGLLETARAFLWIIGY